ncbi:MAG: dihydrofolate reductase family protein [Erysipelotrichaceae bacterium]
MKRKIIMTLAMSLDGYIADEQGGFDWIVGDGDSHLNTPSRWDYFQFLEGVDLVVMGKACYDQNMHADFKTQPVWVATHQPLRDHDHVHFVQDHLVEAVLAEQAKPGKDIFLFGGGKLIDAFLKANVIDEYIIGIIPTILGSGRPLFLGNNPTIDLHLTNVLIEEGIPVLWYTKR